MGDRTGLEMLRTLQDRGVQLGFDVYMECAIARLLKDGTALRRRHSGTGASRTFRLFKAKSVVSPPVDRQSLAHHFEFVGIYR